MGTETTPRPQKKDDDVVALRSGPFELDLRSGELRRAGSLQKLQPQPFKVLALLASRPGELVTREEIQGEVWPVGTFVDFEQSLNFCIRQIRAVLGDSALTPRYIETLPRRGYRWIAGPVEKVGAGPAILEWPRPAALARPAPLADLEGGSEPGPAPEPGPPAPGRGEARRLPLWPAAAAAALAVLAAALYLGFARRGGEATPSFHRITFRRGIVASARFAPDGQVVYSAAWEGDRPTFFSARPETRESRRIEVEGRSVVGISQQAEVAFLRGSTLARAPLAGGPPKEVLAGVRLADWTPDGSEFLVVRHGQGPGQIEFPIGTILGPATWPTHARISPDRRHVAFLEHPMWGDDRGSVAVLDRQGKKRTLSDGWASVEGLAWSPRSDEVWFTGTRVGADSALHAVSLDGRLRTVLPAMGRLILQDIAPDGRVLIERSALRSEIRFGRVGEPEERDLSWLDLSSLEDLSADGRTVLFMESGEGGGPDYTTFLRQTDGSLPVRLGTGRGVALSPDRRSVLSIPIRERDRIDVVPTGAGETRSIRHPGLTEYSWAGFVPPDGRTVAFTARDGEGRHRSYLQDLDGGAPRPVLPEGVYLGHHAFSPDGRLVAQECKGEGDEWRGVCIYPVEGGEPRRVPGVEKPVWVRGWDDAGRLFVTDKEKPMVAEVSRLDPRTGRLEPWRTVAPPDRAGVVGVHKLFVTPDGQAYAYSYMRELADLYVVTHAR